MRWLYIVVFTLVLFPSGHALAADESAGDAAWAEIAHGPKLPQRPPEWKQKDPSPEELAEFNSKVNIAAVGLADQFKAFYKKYPNHPKAADAWIKEQDFRKMAVASQKAVLAAKAPQPGGPEKTRQIPAEVPVKATTPPIQQAAAAPSGQSNPPARQTPPIASKAVTGKPLKLAFTAVDGRQVDVSQMAGKVVLVDCWATWCGPCVAEMPHVRKTYKELHDRGFEIVGISFDLDRSDLTKFVSQNAMPWPQYFDGHGWTNAINNQFQIRAIPTMYLLDKKGVLRETNARENLSDKVRALLAEK